jgi:hypothetical protein
MRIEYKLSLSKIRMGYIGYNVKILINIIHLFSIKHYFDNYVSNNIQNTFNISKML